MRIHVRSAFAPAPDNGNNFASRWLREGAERDPFGVHTLTNDPEEADIILFVEGHPEHDPYLLSVFGHPIYRRYGKKCFLYHDADLALPLVRGVYPSILKADYREDRCRSYGYIARVAVNPFIRYDDYVACPPEWLYTFAGENNCAVRDAIFAQEHEEALIRNTTGRRHWAMADGGERNDFMRTYAQLLSESTFSLCPRGLGPTSYRLFETMEAGRVPVILSDNWCLPGGPKWEEFSIQIPEANVSQIGDILRERRPEAEAMGKLARAAWEDYFSKDVCFHRLVELCIEIQATPLKAFSQTSALSKMLKTDRLKMQLRPFVKNRLAAATS